MIQQLLARGQAALGAQPARAGLVPRGLAPLPAPLFGGPRGRLRGAFAGALGQDGVQEEAGQQATGSSTMTSTLLGLPRSDARSRSEFLALTGVAS